MKKKNNEDGLNHCSTFANMRLTDHTAAPWSGPLFHNVTSFPTPL